MSVFALGLNHQTAPVDLRGRFAFPLEQLSPALKALVGQFGRPGAGGLVVGAPEVALLSTCNRTELYVAAPEHNAALVRPVADWLAAHGGVTGAQLLDHS
jgi:glutamyl-tRNA reductase